MVGRGRSCFEGWYFKLVDAEGAQPYAIIPGVFLGDDAHAFVQVLDGRAGTSAYHRFPLSEFHAATDDFDIRIGRSRFDRSGIRLAIDDGESSAGQAVHGAVQFSSWRGWPVTWASPGVMGGILSMDHALSGVLEVDGAKTSFEGGRGYTEKDWGRAFPRGYVWAQSNHFGEEGVSVTASVARIPWLTGSFRGHLIGLLLGRKLHRFTTYTGSEIERIEVTDHAYRVSVSDQTYRLEISATKTEGAILHAPYEKQMLERVAETMTSSVALRFARRDGDATLFEGSGQHGCLEVQGDLAAVLNG
jgi:hypothetical protein